MDAASKTVVKRIVARALASSLHLIANFTNCSGWPYHKKKQAPFFKITLSCARKGENDSMDWPWTGLIFPAEAMDWLWTAARWGNNMNPFHHKIWESGLWRGSWFW